MSGGESVDRLPVDVDLDKEDDEFLARLRRLDEHPPWCKCSRVCGGDQ